MPTWPPEPAAGSEVKALGPLPARPPWPREREVRGPQNAGRLLLQVSSRPASRAHPGPRGRHGLAGLGLSWDQVASGGGSSVVRPTRAQPCEVRACVHLHTCMHVHMRVHMHTAVEVDKLQTSVCTGAYPSSVCLGRSVLSPWREHPQARGCVLQGHQVPEAANSEDPPHTWECHP